MGIFVVAFHLLGKYSDRLQQDAEQLPYIPPVTPANLTNEEILLRGSDASAQDQSYVLLRGTQNREEAGGQELLRGSQGQDNG